MNREIKFRAWNENYKQMKKVYGLDLEGERVFLDANLATWWLIDYCELMQYTGLNDKNGIEICEGNVLFIKSTISQPGGKLTTKTIGDVQILNGMTYLVGKTWQDIDGKDIRISDYEALLLSPELFEIIGNIYENPELLEVEQ